MSITDPVPFDASLSAYERQAEKLHEAVISGQESAQWHFKWMHPGFRGKTIAAVKAATLELPDAQTVIALDYGFESWAALEEFTERITRDASKKRFERAVEAVVSGDLSTLVSLLSKHPELVRCRSTRSHQATLLHYLGANGVEDARQKTPGNAVEVARTLLEAGAEVDALANFYGSKCTTMSLLVSSCHPANAGLQEAIAELLLDWGAAFDGPGTNWQSALMTSLIFGYLSTAEMLVRRGAPINNIAAAAGLGRRDEVAALLPEADPQSRHIALALAAQLGHAEVVQLLLEAGEDPNRYNPDGYHSHATPLHQAVGSNHLEVVKLFVKHGALLNIKDTIYQGTPLDWAIHGKRKAIEEYLRHESASDLKN